MHTFLSSVFSKSCRRIFFTCLLFQLGHIRSYAQADMFSSIQTQFKQYNKQTIQEKLFVHTDKPFYTAGEILWFKLYDVDARYNKPLAMSKVAYVELLNKDLKPVLQAKIELRDASGNGSFFLPLTIGSGNYRLRAYTNWMKNFSPDFYFEKNITIVNTLRVLDEKPAEIAPVLDIQFFPEGGNLVNGLESTVAFRVVDQFGKGVDFKGTLTDEDNNTVASFEPLQFGMGHFSFTPVANKKYKAIIRIGSNNAVLSEFPSAFDQGYTMHVADSGRGQVSVTVSTNIRAPNQFVYLFVQTRQMMKTAAVQAIVDGRAVFTVDKTKLGEGISDLTVFNMTRQPVCERLYFKRPVGLDLSAGLGQDEFRLRKKVTVNIDVEDAGKPVAADMSMSVYRVDSLVREEQMDILSYLWLDSDLQGNIESPGYYFSNSGPAVDEATDNLMLTHGWRRFRWEDILQDKTPAFEFVPEYAGHLISGKIIDRKSGLPAENQLAYLSVPGIHFQLGGCLSNKNGQIQFDIKDFYGANEIVVQTDNQKDSMYRLDILSPFVEQFSSTPVPHFDISEDVEEDLLSQSIGTQVQNAYQEEQLQKFEMPKMKDSTAFYGAPDKKFFLDEYTRFITMEEVMREYISGVSLRRHQQKFHFRILNDPYRLFFDDDPLILFDGVPVFDADKIIAEDPLKVKKIEVVNRQYFLGPVIASGIISYTTYKGDLEGFQLDPSALVLEYEGLQQHRDFFSPVYETEKQVSSRMPDFRSLLYWAPDINVDQRGKKQLIFYTSDQPGKYVAVIQGINADGKAGSKTITFDVIK